mmetsp:Transcript_24603/g.73856  ORF Transcript_24603/g.73856 Transcript_24603/m.73856 type:complete len:301 (-) Transcript_24603:80-982(-)
MKYLFALLATQASCLVQRPPRLSLPRRHLSLKSAATMDLKSTIGNIFVPPPPPPPATVVEGAESFRMLGVPPTAEYDEVQAAVAALKEKYAGDTKKLLKIDVAKDKIAELRLRQRVSGTLGVTNAVAAVDKSAQDYKDQALNRAVAKATPKFVKRLPYMFKPFWKIEQEANRKDRELQAAHVKMTGYYWLGFAAAGAFFPSTIGYLKFASAFLFVSHNAQRGQPPVVKDGSGMAGAMRDPNYPDYVWAVLFTAVHSVVGFALAGVAVPFVTLIRPMQTRFLIVTGMQALADSIWQPHMAK